MIKAQQVIPAEPFLTIVKRIKRKISLLPYLWHLLYYLIFHITAICSEVIFSK